MTTSKTKDGRLIFEMIGPPGPVCFSEDNVGRMLSQGYRFKDQKDAKIYENTLKDPEPTHAQEAKPTPVPGPEITPAKSGKAEKPKAEARPFGDT